MATIPAALDSQLRTALDELAAAARFSGTVLLRTDAGRVILSRGMADREAGALNDRTTRYNTASITKLLTAVTVCRLSESGVLDLDAPISTWLSADEVAAVDRVTPHHLLSHTAGFPEEVPDLVPPAGGRARSGWIDLARDLPPLFPAGTGWQYSNAGYAILGEIVERVSGGSYFDAVERLVLRPAGMTASGFEDTSVAAAGRAIGYLVPGDGSPGGSTDNRGSELGRGAPFGYATSTVEDLERLIDLIASRTIVNGINAARILHGEVSTGVPGRFAGYGMFREVAGDVDIVTTAGAGPGISAWLDLVLDSGYLAIILANFPKPAAHELGAFLRRAALRPSAA